MYSSSSRGSNAYGQQQQQQQQTPYSSQSAYAQNLGAGYSLSSVGVAEGSMGSRHSSMLGGHQDAEASGYRSHASHPSSASQYGGQYSSVYGSTAQQIPSGSSKGTITSTLEGRSVYGTLMPESPKYTSSDYVSSSTRGYGHKSDQLYSDRIPDYTSIDRRQYGERHGTYVGIDKPSDQASRYGDSMSFSHKHQAEAYDRLDQASLLRQEQLLKVQSLQSASLDGNSRQADYLAARGQAIRPSGQDRHPAQDTVAYGGRIDSDPRSLTMLSSSSYGGQHTPSILGAAPQRNVDDLMFGQTSSNPGYGVSLPPGRDYGTGKGLHGTTLESDYPTSILTRRSLPRIDDLKDDRAAYVRELERREKERHRDYLREREREREKDRERERQRERQRERERERERARERERERERILERREKEKDRERKHVAEIRRERTPPRLSRDRGGSLLTKDAPRSLRRESPHRESSHRHHSPVKEKRREYVCKVFSSSLVEVERDYLSLDKRYPRLFISPECSKVVVNWPKGNLKLSFHTPVSFEHDFVEEMNGAEQKELSSKQSVGERGNLDLGVTVWNAKMVLMSGLSQNALEELSSNRSYDDRIPHFCNMLRFSLLKRNNSFMAIGGPWDTVDGGDPSVDDSSLVHTAIRYAKDITNLNLENCQHWNRFLEIHYDRIGKDGLFSHKEVTVIYIPDLSHCIPSLDLWRDQWFAYKKDVAERERLCAPRKEKPGEKKEEVKGKECEHPKDVKRDKHAEIKKEASSSGQSKMKTQQKEKFKGDLTKKDGNENDVLVENEDGGENNNVKEDKGESTDGQKSGSAKSVKKKIIKKVVRPKTADRKDAAENTTKQNDGLVEKDSKEKTVNTGVTVPQDGSSSNPPVVRTVVRKKIVKKVPVRKNAKKENETETPVVATVKDSENPEDKTEPAAAVEEASTKTTVKKKIIRRVPKRKAATTDGNNVITDSDTNRGVVNEEVKSVKAENQLETETKTSQDIEKREEKKAGEKGASVSKVATETKEKLPVKDDCVKEDKERKSHDRNDEPTAKSSKDAKEKKTREEPPRHPGLILQTKGSKDAKLQSMSLSLDSLLDYSDKDIEDSTFELSLFAECLYEMLQFEMGCRILNFLQKLRVNFVTKRNLRKRQREEASKREPENNSSEKRVKKDEAADNNKVTKTDAPNGAHPDDRGSSMKEGTTSTGQVEEMKHGEANEDEGSEEDMEEDPEEEPEEASEEEQEEEEMPDADANKEEKDDTGKAIDDEAENVAGNENGRPEPAKKTLDGTPNAEADGEKKTVEVEKTTGKKDVDKELLQAFRFFDRNRVGFIRVEDMRLIIHNLGKFLSHRDVKELVQSALLESNTGRDDKILYDKLMREVLQ